MTISTPRRTFATLIALTAVTALALVGGPQAAVARPSSDYLSIAVGAAAGRIDILRPRGSDDGGSDQPSGARPSRTAAAGTGGLAAAVPSYGIQYNGGPVIQQAKVVAIYWGSAPIYPGGPTPGTTGTAASDGSLIGYFLRNLGGSPHYQINTSYTNSSGTPISANVTYTGFWANNNNVHTDCQSVSDAQMRTELINGFNTGKITYNASTIYAIFSAGKVNLGGGFGNCPGTNFQYCAYHTYFSWNGKIVKYAAMPYNNAYPGSCTAFQGGGPANGDPGADAEVNTLTHEIEEANTDPQLNAWWVSNSSSPYYQEENADMCAWTFGTLNPDGKGNITIGGKSFLVQRNWLNTAPSGGCAQTYGSAAVGGSITGTVTAAAGGAAIAGATVSIAGGASTTTNGSGVYTLANVAVGTYTVTASAAGFISSSAGGVSVTSGNTTSQDFALAAAPPAGTLTGKVTRNSNGNPIAGATVSIAGGASTTTNGSGVYTFSNLAAGTYSVTVSATNWASKTLGATVSVGNTTTLNFVLKKR